MNLTLSDIDQLPSDELTLWFAYSQLHGWPTDRIEHTVAIGLAYVVNSLGGKIKPTDIMPDYRPQRELPPELAAWQAKANMIMSKGMNKLKGGK